MSRQKLITDDRSQAIFHELARRKRDRDALVAAILGGFEVFVTASGESPWFSKTTEVAGYAATVLNEPCNPSFFNRVKRALLSLDVHNVSIHGYRHYRGIRRRGTDGRPTTPGTSGSR